MNYYISLKINFNVLLLNNLNDTNSDDLKLSKNRSISIMLIAADQFIATLNFLVYNYAENMLINLMLYRADILIRITEREFRISSAIFGD